MASEAGETRKSSVSWRREICILLLAVAASPALMLAILPDSPMVDEHFHHGQILFLLSGEFQRVPELTTPLGYHRAVAFLARATGVESVTALRAFSALLGLSCVFWVWLFLHRQASRLALIRSLQVLFCPLLWPFYFLIYTDLSSLSLVLIGVNLFAAGLIWQTAAIGILMLAWRQNNIVWSGLLWVAYCQSNWPMGNRLAVWKPFILRLTILALPMLVFAVFLWANQGVALGDHAMHRIGQALYVSQLWFLLLVVWLLLLPLHIACLPKAIDWLRERGWRVVVLALLPPVIFFSFDVTHPYNLALPDFHLRNGLLSWLDQDWFFLVLGALAMTWTVLTLIVSPLNGPLGRWLYPLTALALLPVELIEQRYYIVPVVLFLMLREPLGPRVEMALLLWFVAVSGALTTAIASTRFFL